MAISRIDATRRRTHEALSRTAQVNDDSPAGGSFRDMRNLMPMVDQLMRMMMQWLNHEMGSGSGGGSTGGAGGPGSGSKATAPAPLARSSSAGSAAPPVPAAPDPAPAAAGGATPPAKAAPAPGATPPAADKPPAASPPAASGASGPSGASTTVGPPSGGYVDAAKYGVVGDGTTDNTAALQSAFVAGKATGQPVYLAAGTYAHSGTLKLDGVKLTGDGEKTVLKATNPDRSAITLTGDRASLSNVKVELDNAPSRSSQPDAAAVLVQNATNAKVSNVVTQGASSNGIRLDNAQNSTITGNLVQGSNADGIALMNGSSNNEVRKNVVYQAGDDAFSDDSYTSDARQDTGNVFDSNMALDGKYGRGFALMGSTGDTLTNNIVNGSSGVGIATGTDSNSGTMTGGGNTVSGNTVRNEFDANSGNATPTTPQAVLDAMGSTSVSDILGWAATLVDKSKYATAYTPGTGNGANNSNGIRT